MGDKQGGKLIFLKITNKHILWQAGGPQPAAPTQGPACLSNEVRLPVSDLVDNLHHLNQPPSDLLADAVLTGPGNTLMNFKRKEVVTCETALEFN